MPGAEYTEQSRRLHRLAARRNNYLIAVPPLRVVDPRDFTVFCSTRMPRPASAGAPLLRRSTMQR